MRYLLTFFLALFIVGCSSSQAPSSKVTIEFRVGSFSPQKDWQFKILRDSGQKVYLSDKVVVSTTDIAVANAGFTEQGMPMVAITLTEAGKQKMAEATERYLDRPIGIVVDGELLSAPVIKEKITGGMLMINGISSAQEAKKIADGFNH